MRAFYLLLMLLTVYEAAAVTALSVEQIAPGIYVHFGKHELPDKHNHGAIANIGFIVGDRCVAVIDSGGNPEQGRALEQAIVDTTDKPVCYVVNTHVHPDHIYGNIVFKAPGVQFVGHHKLARAMAARAAYYIDKASEQLDLALSPAHFIPPDLTVNTHMKIDLGGRELMLTAHRTAHTDNDVTVYDKKTDTLWVADLLFIEHLPVIDGSLNGWLAEIHELEKTRYRYVIPGHGPLVTDWPSSLQPQKRYLEALQKEIRTVIETGGYIEDAVAKVGLQFKNQWRLFDEFHRRNVTTAFAELEWE
ncbi:MAG: quinoprotein relay system zinc metallohydrolase 2 [Gammaproteobacteria bacterium]